MNVVLRRIVGLPVVLLGVSFIVFISLRMIPGDPVVILTGLGTSAEEQQRVREDLGLDKPVLLQFGIWIWDVVNGDLGESLITGQPVFATVMEHFWWTLQLTLVAIVLATTAGITVGVVAAARPYSRLDNLVTIFSLVGVSVPSFWLGIMMIMLFSVYWQWFPAGGSGTWRHLILPALSLAAFSMGILARMTRASMLEVLGQDYIRTARAKGLRDRAILFRHALKNSLLQITTVIGLQFGYLLAGAVVTETVFRWPGMGRLLVMSIFRRDFPMVQGTVLVVAACFVLVNVAMDLLYTWIDPRIRA